MGEPGSSRAAAAAATASPSDESDERIARKLHVMEQLVHVFGFPKTAPKKPLMPLDMTT